MIARRGRFVQLLLYSETANSEIIAGISYTQG
jgi:hypothetical protein